MDVIFRAHRRRGRSGAGTASHSVSYSPCSTRLTWPVPGNRITFTYADQRQADPLATPPSVSMPMPLAQAEQVLASGGCRWAPRRHLLPRTGPLGRVAPESARLAAWCCHTAQLSSDVGLCGNTHRDDVPTPTGCHRQSCPRHGGSAADAKDAGPAVGPSSSPAWPSAPSLSSRSNVASLAGDLHFSICRFAATAEPLGSAAA